MFTYYRAVDLWQYYLSKTEVSRGQCIKHFVIILEQAWSNMLFNIDMSNELQFPLHTVLSDSNELHWSLYKTHSLPISFKKYVYTVL